MRVLAAGAVLALLATGSVALAESSLLEQEYQRKKQEQADVEKEYQRMQKATQSRTPAATQAPTADPWGTVRTPDKNSK
jgi:hypothetical protein